MSPVVQCFTGSPIPEPMPVVVNQVALILSSRRRSLPQFKVKIGRRSDESSLANGFPVIDIPASRKINSADGSRVELPDHHPNVSVSPSLASHLHVQLI